MNANIKSATRREVYRRDGYRCALCDSSQGLQVHHAIPRGEGGTDSPHNLITLCSYCHSHAHGRPLYDTPVTAAEIAQACVEYLADYYAPDWNPWAIGSGGKQGGRCIGMTDGFYRGLSPVEITQRMI